MNVTKRVLAFLSLAGLLAGFVALAACDKMPPIPIPSPLPTDEPGEPWDCDNEPTLAGEVQVKGGIEGEYNVWRKDSVFAKYGSQDAHMATAKIASDIGAKSVKVYAGGQAFGGVFDIKALKKLRADKSVQFFHKKVPMRALVGPTKLPGLDRIGQRDLPLNGQIEFALTGEHSALVTNDTGIYFEHEAFRGRMQQECKTVVTFGGCNDRHGHGTHVTGTAAGTTWGIATESIIYAGRSLDENGSGTDTGVAEILTWTGDLAAGNTSKRFVTNLSLGGGFSPTVNRAVCYAHRKNVLVVVAAGNDGRQGGDSCDGSPSNVKQALTVGAMDPRNDNVADFSNRGKCVDLYAPGVDIESAWNTGGSNTISGTSMATPHVAGMGLLFRTARFELSPSAVHDAIVELATKDTLNRVPSGTANLMLFVPLRIPAPGRR